MGNSQGHEWSAYLQAIVDRPGWSVARLAREAAMNPSTIFGYLKDGPGKKVTIETIVAIANAAGDDPVTAFLAAAGLIQSEPEDREIGLIWQSDLPQGEKERQIQRIADRRRRDLEQRIAETQEILRVHTKAS